MRMLIAVAALAAMSCSATVLLPRSARTQGTEEGYFTGSDGNRLYYRKLGTGEPTLVYLHGGPINMNDGGYEIDRLARGRTLIVIDQRSGGRSELVQDTARLVFSRYVEDVEALRVHFGLRKMVLAGQSFGALVAASYAASHPDRVERLMFWSPGPPTSAFARAREIATNRFLGEADVRRAADLWSRMASGADSEVVPLCREWVRIIFRFYVSDPAALSRMKGDYCAGTAAAIRHQNRAMDLLDASAFKEFDLRPELRSLRIPTLVFEGAVSRVPLDATEEWARVMPDARLILIPGSGHQTWLEGGDAFFEAVERFLRGEWPPMARVVRR
jgi:proline iminopeptidase